MKLPFPIQIDPGFLTDEHGRPELCEGCGMCRPAHVHHIEHKAMGGRHGAAKIHSERAENKIHLCVVCHEAAHLIPARLGSFSCAVCPRLTRCYYGAKLNNLPDYDDLPKPF